MLTISTLKHPKKRTNTHSHVRTQHRCPLLSSHSPVRVFSRNLGALDLLPGGAQLRRYPRLDLESRGYESGNEDQDGAYRQAEGPQSRRHIYRFAEYGIYLASSQRVAEGGWGDGVLLLCVGCGGCVCLGFRVRKISKISPLITLLPRAKKNVPPPRAQTILPQTKKWFFSSLSVPIRATTWAY